MDGLMDGNIAYIVIYTAETLWLYHQLTCILQVSHTQLIKKKMQKFY